MTLTEAERDAEVAYRYEERAGMLTHGQRDVTPEEAAEILDAVQEDMMRIEKA